MIGTVVGNYKIAAKIGEGGMGSVFKGIDMMLEREVAIKVLKPELAGQPEIVERFRSEAVTLARLNHPRIATLFSFFRHGDDFLMVMEFVPGQTLGDVITAHGAIHWNDALPIFCQALEGIDHAHSMGIIHRDVKPANIMLTAAGAVKVMDFGIARVLGTARMTRAGHLIGTIEYMSPEQVKGQHTDARSDIYSAGIVLYELLTGRVPFSSDSEFDLMRSQIEEAPQSPRYFARSIPEGVEQAILKALAKDPEARFETAGQFRAALINTGLALNAQIDYSGHTGGGAERNSGSHTVPPATRIASSRELVVDSGVPGIKGTRIASPGETFSQAPGSRAGFDPRGIQADAGVGHQIGILKQGAPPKSNWKLFAGAGASLVLLLIGALTLVVVLSKSGQPEQKNSPRNSITTPTPVTSAAQPGTPGGAASTGPAPNDASSMGIKVTPEDPSKTTTTANTSKNSSGSDTDSSGKTRRESTGRSTKTDTTQRSKGDDSASKRSKALRALDQ